MRKKWQKESVYMRTTKNMQYMILSFLMMWTNTRRLVKSTVYVKPFKKSKVHLFIMNSKKFKACGLVAWKNYWKTKRIFIVIVIVIRWKMSPVITWKKQDSLVKSLPIYKIILTTNLWDVIWK